MQQIVRVEPFYGSLFMITWMFSQVCFVINILLAIVTGQFYQEMRILNKISYDEQYLV